MTINDYLIDIDSNHQADFTALYQLLQDLLLNASQKISYGMPAFYSDKHPIIYLAAAKNHLGLYPTSGPIKHFAAALSSYRTSKGVIQIPYNQALPVQLITDIVQFRLQELKTAD